MQQNEAQQVLELLFANLLDDNQSKLSLMGEDAFDENAIPEEWKWHRAIFKAFYEAERVGDPPTIGNIALLSRLKDKDLVEKLEKIQKRSGKHSVRSCANFFRGWSDNRYADLVFAEIGAMQGLEYGDVQERYNQAADRLLTAIPLETKQAHTRLSIIENLETVQARRVELREQGQALGAVWHLKKLREGIPVMRSGDVTLMTAMPKAGKTTSVMAVAQHNAKENDTDVLVLLLETPPTTIEERFLAQHLLIPAKALREGRVDLRKPPFAAKHKQYKELQQQYWDERGRVYLHYIAGAKLSEIAGQIRVHKRLADSRNRPLLVIIDYLQRIPEIGGKNSVESLAVISNSMKDFAVRFDVHILLLSQESLSGVNKEQGDSRAHGSNTPIFIAQVHMALRVLNSTEDVIRGDNNGEVMLDALGNPRYYQYQGPRQRQSIIRYDVLRANDDETVEAYALMENPLFIMEDVSMDSDYDGKEWHFYNGLYECWQKQIKSFGANLKDDSRRLI